MNVVSLFTGAGGFDLGLERAGMKVIAQVEINRYANQVLRRHYPQVPHKRDIRDAKGNELAPAGADVVMGGSPCQDVSTAGRREGLTGNRSGLWFEQLRIIDEVKPAWVLWENVPGVLSSNEGRDFGVILAGLVDCGYRVAWRVLDSQYFGIPQRRRRVYAVGHRCDGRAAGVLFDSQSLPGSSQTRPKAWRADVAGTGSNPDSAGVTGYRARAHGEYVESNVSSTLRARDYKSGTVDLITFDANASGFALKESKKAYPTLTSSGGGNKVPSIAAWDARNHKLQEGGVSGTIQAGHSLNYLNPVLDHGVVRRLTPVEVERLQGFPDNWTAWGVSPAGETVPISTTQRYKLMGNAVSVPVAEWLGRRMMEADCE